MRIRVSPSPLHCGQHRSSLYTTCRDLARCRGSARIAPTSPCVLLHSQVDSFRNTRGVYVDALKKAAAAAAVDLVPTNTIIGLGSGSTFVFVLKELGERVRQGRLCITGVPTSYQTRLLAKDCGIPIQDLMDVDCIDLAVDGADEIDAAGNLIKGAGGAHVMEKVVAA